LNEGFSRISVELKFWCNAPLTFFEADGEFDDNEKLMIAGLEKAWA